jgi:hypothetical protein
MASAEVVVVGGLLVLVVQLDQQHPLLELAAEVVMALLAPSLARQLIMEEAVVQVAAQEICQWALCLHLPQAG